MCRARRRPANGLSFIPPRSAREGSRGGSKRRDWIERPLEGKNQLCKQREGGIGTTSHLRSLDFGLEQGSPSANHDVVSLVSVVSVVSPPEADDGGTSATASVAWSP